MERDNRRYGREEFPERSERSDFSEFSDWEERAERTDRTQRTERRTSGSRTGSSRRRHRTPMRKQKRSAFSRSMTYILAVCGVSILLALVGWAMMGDVLALNKEPLSATITVDNNRDFDSVVKQLKDTGIIKYKGIFRLFSSVAHGEDKIRPGTYTLTTDMDYRAILNNLGSRSTSRNTVEVTITEGMTERQIFQLLEEKGVSTVKELEEMAATHNYNFSFLLDLPLGDPTRLEGYLFPDTYEFYTGDDPRFVLNKMLVNFDAKVTDDLRQQIWDKGYSIGQMMTIASMIEKEATIDDRTTVASVIFNRLNNPYAGTQGYLQVDATIQYVLPEGQTVTQADYETVDSPYNTYLNKGLPPGPIANPGMGSIMAAINPERTSYFYYAVGDDGVHHFFSSYSEFQRFLAS